MLWQGRTVSPAAERDYATPPHVLEWRMRNKSFSDIAALELWVGNVTSQVDLMGPDGSERLSGPSPHPTFSTRSVSMRHSAGHLSRTKTVMLSC
jgi:hypothetical protein